jgi:hypothetical protein
MQVEVVEGHNLLLLVVVEMVEVGLVVEKLVVVAEVLIPVAVVAVPVMTPILVVLVGLV